jgi:tetratricopeptide (TPR) repeat protein
MRIPLPRAVPLVLATCGLLACCSQPYARGRLAPRGVPGISDREPNRGERSVATRGTRDDAGNPVAPATALAKVPAARVTETEVLAHVETLGARYGRAGLMALEPGDTLVDRLRYCTSRVILERTKEVLPELQRLAADHPDNPLVWRQLGWAHYWVDDQDAARRCMRQAYTLAKLDGCQTCPHLPSFFGQLLIERRGTREEGVKLLRNELAEGTDYARACWTLAKHFSAREQHVQALACMDAALARAPGDTKLRVGKAKVLLDLHRPDEVLALLEPLLRESTPDRFAVETVMRARFLKAEFGAALALVDLLLNRSDLTADEKQDLQTRREEIAEAKRIGRKKLIRDWEVFAVLRGHPELQTRRLMLRNVVGQKNVRIRERALFIAFNSESPALRADALILLIPTSTDPMVNVRAGLKDENGNVRGTAAILAAGARKDRDKLAGLVLEFLAKETDGYAFRQMHTALGKLTGVTVELPFGAAEDPKQRAVIVAAWQKTELGRRGK